jgi:diguanylate cyclase (GGDEF)-like protein
MWVTPPTAAIGSTGWWVAGVAIAAWVVAAVAVSRGGALITLNLLVLMIGASLGSMVVLEWLAGGYEASYGELYVLLAAYAATWSPRRIALLFAALPLVIAAPLAYGPVTVQAVGEFATRIVTLYSLAFLVLVVMSGARASRERLHRESERANQLARVDPLTGLGNRRAFDELLGAAISRCDRIGTPLSIAVLDLNRFKLINDRHGHEWGDEVLRQVARTIERSVRAYDVCFRWGGDEFVLILADTPGIEAEHACERLESAIAESCAGPEGEPVSVAWGLAERAPGMDAAELLHAADRAMLARKERDHLAPA